MLIVSRHASERIVIGDGSIEVAVHEIRRSAVKLAVRAEGHQVMRGEVWDEVARKNKEVAESSFDPRDVDRLVAVASGPQRQGESQ